jgi:gluconate 5-dehydrogenase
MTLGSEEETAPSGVAGGGHGLAGKKALVVGAARGIGRATAAAFARAGADVVAVDLDALEGVTADVQALERECLPVVCDIADLSAVERLIDDAYEWAGAVDILINNAAVVGDTLPPDVTVEDWDALFAVNLRAPYFMSQAVGKRMLAGDGGTIINVATIAGEFSTGPQVPYQATKAGLLQLTRGLAHLWAPKVRVNSVSPSFVRTELNAEWLSDPKISSWVEERTPLARYGTLEEMAAAILFLASPASSYVTGQNLRVDGGWTART